MSVRVLPNGYEVRWRDGAGRNRSRSFRTRDDAEQFDRAMHAWQAKRRADAAWDLVPRVVREQVAVHG